MLHHPLCLSPAQRPSSLISDSSVEPVPSPSGSSPSPSPSSSTPSNDVTSSGPNLNITTCAAKVSHDCFSVHLLSESQSVQVQMHYCCNVLSFVFLFFFPKGFLICFNLDGNVSNALLHLIENACFILSSPFPKTTIHHDYLKNEEPQCCTGSHVQYNECIACSLVIRVIKIKLTLSL